MGQTTDEIEAYIDDRREDLGSNLHELEHRVKSVTDWKGHFQKNPMTMMGVAFGGGILLATIVGKRKNRRGERRLSGDSYGSEPRAGTTYQKHKALETWDNIKGALIGVAATRFKDFVGDVVPGFHEQFQRVENNTKPVQPLSN
jgi:hypothetical protein